MKSAAHRWIALFACGWMLSAAPWIRADTYHFHSEYDGPWEWDELTMTITEGGTIQSHEGIWERHEGTARIRGYKESVTNFDIPPAIEWEWIIRWTDGEDSGILTAFYYHATIVDIGTNAFANRTDLETVVIPDTVSNICAGAFRNCTSLRSVTIPGTVTNIAASAFSGCTNLRHVNIPSSVRSIGSKAFSGCTGLREIVLGPGVTSLGYSAFQGCASVTQVVANCSISSWDNGVFMYCSNLETVVIGDAVTGLEKAGNGNYPFDNCPNIREFSLGTGVTKIPASYFTGRTNLETVALSRNVVSIGISAFYNCSKLTGLQLPAALTTIGSSAFYGCVKLVSINVPASVTTIGASAFCNCKGLTKVTYSGNAPTAGSGIYSGTPAELTSWVRQGSTGWDGKAESTALPATWQGRPIRRWGTAEYEAAGEAVPDTRTETGGVPLVWLDERNLARDGDYEAAAASDAANGRPVWECYVAGLDPEDPEAEFMVRLWFEDGAVHLGWTPDWSDAENGSGRTYRLMGKKSMGAEWEDVPDPADLSAEGWRYFRVGVSLPPEQGE